MNRNLKIALVAGGLVLAGLAGVATLAEAHRRGDWMHGGFGSIGGGHGEHLAMLFDRFDANKDGKVNQDEIDTVRKAKFAEFDANKDGKLSLDEFEKLWADQMHQHMVRAFQRLDTEASGAVTLDQYMKPTENLVARFGNKDGVIDKTEMMQRFWHRRGGDGDGPDAGTDGGPQPN